MAREYSSAQYTSIIIKVKKYLLFITDTTYDDYLDVKVPAALEFAETYCKQYFSIKNPDYDVEVPGSEEFILDIPNPVYEYIAKDVESKLDGVKSESLGDHSITYAQSAEPIKLLTQYRKMFPDVGGEYQWVVS